MEQPQLTHHIQLNILRSMLNAPVVRYSQLKPANIEANLFMYHLKQLIRENLVHKVENGYALTRRGKQFADRASLETMHIRVQPKVVVILAVQRQGDDQWLLLKRKHQPFLDYKGFPSGKVHYGEDLERAARRELAEKCGLSGVGLTLRGNVIMRFMDQDEPVNHVIGYVFSGVAPPDTIVSLETDHYASYFAPEAELFSQPCFKGHKEILDWLKGGKLFIEDVDFESDY